MGIFKKAADKAADTAVNVVFGKPKGTDSVQKGVNDATKKDDKK